VSIYIRTWLGAAALVMAGCFWPAPPAQAQAFPCTGAAGEVMVGQGQGGAPLCSGGSGGSSAAPRVIYTYGALAWHADGMDVWVQGNRRQEGVAHQAALDACNRDMGGGCQAMEWNNSAMSLIQDQRGLLSEAWHGQGGGEGRAEVRRVLDACSALQELPCQIFKTINASQRQYRPGPGARRAYAVVARVPGTVEEGYNRKLYLASGYPSLDEARGLAMADCQAANPGLTCVVGFETGGTFIQTAVSDDGRGYAVVETSIERARAASVIRCQRDGGTGCVAQTTYDTRRRGQFVHDFAVAPAG
jgi:hypothetical protein